MTPQHSECGPSPSSSYYMIQGPNRLELYYSQYMVLIERVSSISQCSQIYDHSLTPPQAGYSGYYTGHNYNGISTENCMCCWSERNGGLNCAPSFGCALQGGKVYWIQTALSMSNLEDFYFGYKCGLCAGQQYHMWFIK